MNSIIKYFLHILVVSSVTCHPILKTFDIWGDSKNNNNSLDRTSKVLNFFAIPSQNECLSTDGRRKGICMNAYECRIENGQSFGQCALGFGVCCVFSSTCQGEIKNNISYFVNPDFPSLSKGMTKCELKIKKVDQNISQFRLDFIHFHLGQPNRRTGNCEDDMFVMSGKNTREIKLCGLNNGQHVYVDVENSDEPLTISMNLSKRNIGRLWEVRVLQVPFNQRAPNGCLQYHTGRKGVIQTMNFAENGRRLANQDYMICMRQENNYCSIAYEPCDENSFKIGSNNNETTPNNNIIQEEGSGSGPIESRNCNDRIIMPCDSDELIMPGLSSGPAMCDLVRCGASLCPDEGPTCRVESSVTPFTIGVQFGAAQREENPEDNLGMCLTFEQLPCV